MTMLYHERIQGFDKDVASIDLPGELWGNIFYHSELESHPLVDAFIESIAVGRIPELGPILSVKRFNQAARKKCNQEVVAYLTPYVKEAAALGYEFVVFTN